MFEPLHLAAIRLADPSQSIIVEFSGYAADRCAGAHTPIHLQPYYRKFGFREGDFPEAEAYSSNAISLPLYPGLGQLDQQRVAETLATLLRP